jgi:hypothetical protein
MSPSQITLDRSSDTPNGLKYNCFDPRERYSPCLDEFSTGSRSFHNITEDQSNQLCTCEDFNVEATKGIPSSNEKPIPEPVKKPPVLRLPPHQVSPTCRRPKGQDTKYTLPPIPIVIDSDLPSESATTCFTDYHTPVGSKFSDKDVFRGLQVATAAACDEDVDKWIEEIMGSGVRRFLADLSAFDGLGINAISTVAKRAAKQRRNQVRAWEKIREKRLLETANGFDGKGEKFLQKVEAKQGKQTDKKIGLVAGDERVPFDRKM